MLRYSTTLLRETATVRRWVKSRGFGFLTRENETQDVFVHHSALGNGYITLEDGQEVEFDLVKAEDGRHHGENLSGVNGAPLVGENGTDAFGVLVGMELAKTRRSFDLIDKLKSEHTRTMWKEVEEVKKGNAAMDRMFREMTR